MVSDEMMNEFKADLDTAWAENPLYGVSDRTKESINNVLTENFEQGSAHSFELFDLIVAVHKEIGEVYGSKKN